MVSNPLLWADHRSEAYEVRVLSAEGRDLGRLDGVVGGSITASTDARIKRAGKLNVVSFQPPEWWATKQLQVFVTVNGVRWSLGIFIPTSPAHDYRGEGVEYEVELHDKLLIPDQDAVTDPYSIEVGTDLRAHVIAMVTLFDAGPVQLGPFWSELRSNGLPYSDGTNKRPLTWDAGTSKLTIINDVLDYIGFFSLSVSPTGTFQSEKYRVPGERSITWQLFEGLRAVHSTQWSYEQDLAGIPNRVVYTTAEAMPDDMDMEVPLLRSSWENMDASDPFSFQSRGRWITEVKLDAEAYSQEELDAMVERRVKNALDPMRKVVVDNAMLPFELNELVEFKSADRHDVLSIRKFEIDLSPGSLMTTTMRGVNREVG